MRKKQPECLVLVTAQSKGETVRMPSYKECCLTAADAQASDKPIIILPARDGKIYEMRKTPIGSFYGSGRFSAGASRGTQRFRDGAFPKSLCTS